MSGSVLSGFIALAGGAVIAALLFVPFVAVQVRRHGSLTLGRTLLALAVPVYALALVTYTLLPLPSDIAAVCAGGGAGVQLQPGQFLFDIVREQAAVSSLLRNPAVQQIALNVALFVPLGVLARLILRRGILITALMGVAVSALIELTQVTGVWGLYPCAYRLLDVDDLIANTAGALVGSLVAPLLGFLRRGDGRGASSARPLTRHRRLLGMLCDALLAFWAALVLTAVSNAIALATTGPAFAADGPARLVIGLCVAFAFLGVVIGTGRTPGEMVVRLRPVERPLLRGAVLRWLLGIGGFLLLQALVRDGVLDLAFAVVAAIAVLTTKDHRGLAYGVLKWRIQDDRTADVVTLESTATS